MQQAGRPHTWSSEVTWTGVMLVMYTSPGRLGSILISCFVSPSPVLVAKRSRSVSLYISTNEASIWYCMGRRNTISQWLPSLICLSACLFLAISCPAFCTTSYIKSGKGSLIPKLSSPCIFWERACMGTSYLQPLSTVSVCSSTHFPSLLCEAGCSLEYLLYSPRNHPLIFFVLSLWSLHRVGLTRPSL